MNNILGFVNFDVCIKNCTWKEDRQKSTGQILIIIPPSYLTEQMILFILGTERFLRF